MEDKLNGIRIVRDADSNRRIPDDQDPDGPHWRTFTVRAVNEGGERLGHVIGFVHGFNGQHSGGRGQWLSYHENGDVAKACSDGYYWYEDAAADAAAWVLALDDIRDGFTIIEDQTT